jgi:hypothetical protein
MRGHQSLCDFKSGRREIDDPRNVPAFGFGRGKQPAVVDEIDVAGFDPQGLLRPAAGFPSDRQQVFEILILVAGKERRELLGRDDLLLATATRLFHVRERRAFDIALLLRPLHCPLDGGDEIAARAGFKRNAVVIDPSLHVMGPEFERRQIAIDRFAKGFEPVLVPAVGVSCPVFGNPV